MAETDNGSESGQKKQHFPKTMTWIGRHLVAGDLDSVRRHVMEVYYLPMRIYYLGHSGRWKGEVEDVLNGFFADRMSHAGFFDKWLASGKPLHRWLIGAFHLFLKERWAGEKRFRRLKRFPENFDISDDEPDASDELEHLRLVSIGRKVLAETETRCRDENMDMHWEIFVRHVIEGQPYADFCDADFGVTKEQAAVMVRTPKRRARAILREVLDRDGIDPDRIGREIEALKEILQYH